jgi:hypothetical protein
MVIHTQPILSVIFWLLLFVVLFVVMMLVTAVIAYPYHPRTKHTIAVFIISATIIFVSMLTYYDFIVFVP